MNKPFKQKNYSNYEDYVTQQKSKLTEGISWLKGYEDFYENFLKATLQKFKLGSTCLCLGARLGREVKVFNDLGVFAIGIDLNPGKDNKYVVTGDVSNIQYSDNLVDMVYTNSLDHFFELDKVLSEIKRVLKPNGLFIILVASPETVKDDKYGAIYWDDIKPVLSYFDTNYGFETITRISADANGWFSDFVIMRLR